MPNVPLAASRSVGRGVAPGVLAVAVVQAVALLLLAPHYGPHRDELYFTSAGHRLAWGYPDQPALTALLARAADLVAPHSVLALRVPSVLASVGVTLLTSWFARALGGTRSAQIVAAVVCAASVIVLALGHLLSTATFDMLTWTAVLALVTAALRAGTGPSDVHRARWLWLGAGLVAGVGLNNKHAVAFLLVSLLVALAVCGASRPALRTPWPWLAAALAALLWLPNLVWQAQHDWPVFALAADIREEYGGLGERVAYVGETLIMFSPLIAVVWITGLVALLRRPHWRLLRPLPVTFLILAGWFLVAGGKGYYLAGAIPPLLAAGCVVVAERWARLRLVVASAVLALSAAVAWPIFLPVLPVHTWAGTFYADAGEDQRETVGWPAYTDEIRAVVAGLTPAQRRTAVVFTQNYGEAGAAEWYDVGLPVFSGHNGWRNWGPPPAGAGPVVVVGDLDAERFFTGCREVARLDNHHDLDAEEQGAPVRVCDDPDGSWAEQWPRLSHYDA
ncbi:Dolichyl-phosphate-mannose-protein mannosyltransferase [Nocardioides terrae]|uniref:Dolichyl-phosphate-mannose-protein mannosyltransferase n=1 Tax=Nocardioides terrae TaxID=574651 RepID=A0A1I1GQU3_9ACTN|nr:glycosyltransferase family 39 protein [Nocardioides terrae]SFC14149.1 Dolichyl-phosphate-mannose-protein mannosyltransferase [Nocardioides terrae]